MVFFIRDTHIMYMTNIDTKTSDLLYIEEYFPGLDVYSTPVWAVLTLDKGMEVSENIPQPSKLKSARLRKNHKRHEREAETTIDDIPKKMVYVYFSTKEGGNVYQYEAESTKHLKFTLGAKKTYQEVNAALPKSVSLVFTAEDKVVTMVNHFMIVQSSLTFFTKTENVEKIHIG